MKKFEIPRHIDFQPAKEFKNRFERAGGKVRDLIDWPEVDYCKCGEQKFAYQKVCWKCYRI